MDAPPAPVSCFEFPWDVSMIRILTTLLLLVCVFSPSLAGDWPGFRGPTGQGTSDERGLPTEWSADKNIVWKVKLPGAGASSPITLGQRVFVTCYSGFALDTKEPGKQEDLRRHVLCFDRAMGKLLWSKEFEPVLPEHKYSGEGAYHGYAASTPVTDGERLYVFFGKSGVYCFDLDGKELWHVIVGKGINGWGSGASPMLYKNLLIVNASIESNALIALDKMTGKEVWRAPKINSAWGTPVVVHVPAPTKGGPGGVELVLSMAGRVAGFDPESGKELWKADGHKGYVCPSVVTKDDIVYALGGNGTSLAIRAGGRGDVTETHVLWRMSKGPNASSAILHEGHLYWANDGGIVHCQEAATGKIVYQQRLPDVQRIWPSPVLADGNLYYVSQVKGVFVVKAQPKFEVVANNVLDGARSNASIAISNGQLFLRNDEFLYCIGKR